MKVHLPAYITDLGNGAYNIRAFVGPSECNYTLRVELEYTHADELVDRNKVHDWQRFLTWAPPLTLLLYPLRRCLPFSHAGGSLPPSKHCLVTARTGVRGVCASE